VRTLAEELCASDQIALTPLEVTRELRRLSRRFSAMSFINLEQLPFVGMSYEFVGETQGAPFSAYIVKAKPGQGPPLHKHPYVEVAFTLEGCATITVGNEQREVKAGSIVVIPTDTPHRFVNSGDTTLRQIDIHASPRFIQTNLV
jgi:mannose-6-phosphate isomerase-like protein (cupin superfamily)